VLLISGLVALIVSASMVPFAVLMLYCGAWCEMHLREIKRGMYHAR
jgi:hypothetical protein